MNAPAVSSTVHEPMAPEPALSGPQQGNKVMPMYLLLDTSGSMNDVEAQLNQVTAQLKQLAHDQPDVADVAHICLIGFNSSAQVLVPLGDLREARLPVITTGGGTNYSAAWKVLEETIRSDRDRLKASGAAMFRALAFMLTDGEPQDGAWESDFHARFAYDPETGTGNKLYPRVVPLGFRQARPDVLAKLAYPKKDGRAYFATPGTNPAEAFAAILDFICKTIVTTGLTAPTGPRHEFPESIPGFTETPSQYAGGDWITS
jgi:hypothetical protein